jgi:hypothetical protein
MIRVILLHHLLYLFQLHFKEYSLFLYCVILIDGLSIWCGIKCGQVLKCKECQLVLNVSRYIKTWSENMRWVAVEIDITAGTSRACVFKIWKEEEQGPFVTPSKKPKRRNMRINCRHMKFGDVNGGWMRQKVYELASAELCIGSHKQWSWPTNLFLKEELFMLFSRRCIWLW